MVMDLFLQVMPDSPEWGEAMEAMEPPPEPLEAEPHAVYWLLTLGPAWRSCQYTFSDTLYDELERMPGSKAWKQYRLWQLAVDVREDHPPEMRVVDPEEHPLASAFVAAGLKDNDASHLADAVRLGASHFLTLDRRVLNRARSMHDQWGISVMRPSEFLVWAVCTGAPWPVGVPWPWESGPIATN